MSFILQIVAIIICLSFFRLVLIKMKIQQMTERSALPWLIGTIGLLVLSIFPGLLQVIADFFGIWWPPATLIFFLLVVIIVIVFFQSLLLSQMDARIYELSMQTVLLKEKNEQLEHDLAKIKVQHIEME